eukprot:4400868-Lingulodinium_polyedra.AAC.1
MASRAIRPAPRPRSATPSAWSSTLSSASSGPRRNAIGASGWPPGGSSVGRASVVTSSRLVLGHFAYFGLVRRPILS